MVILEQGSGCRGRETEGASKAIAVIHTANSQDQEAPPPHPPSRMTTERQWATSTSPSGADPGPIPEENGMCGEHLAASECWLGTRRRVWQRRADGAGESGSLLVGIRVEDNLFSATQVGHPCLLRAHALRLV